MATHGPCETEGPGLLPYLAPSGIKDITAGIRPRSAAHHADGTDHTKPALPGPPGDNGRSRTGQDLHPSLHIV